MCRSCATWGTLVDVGLCGNVCPARTGPLEGPNFPSEKRDLPYWANCLVKIVIVRQNCAKLDKSQGSEPNLARSVAACAQGRRSHYEPPSGTLMVDLPSWNKTKAVELVCIRSKVAQHKDSGAA